MRAMSRQFTGRKFDCCFFFVAAIGGFAMAARYHFSTHTIFWWIASALCLLRACLLFVKIRKGRLLERAIHVESKS